MNTDRSNNNVASTEFLNFSDALHHLRWGERIARRGWDTDVRWVAVDYSNKNNSLYLRRGYRDCYQRSLCGADIMVEDWYVLGKHQ